MTSVATRRGGRPRDPTIDRRAIEATLELLAEVGFDDTTVQAVAQRSGVHTSAIYRRWSSRIDLIEAALSPRHEVQQAEPTGDLRADLGHFVRTYEAIVAAPATRAAAPGLLAHYQRSDASRSPDHYLDISARPQFRAIVDAAPPGTVDPAVDPDDVFDLLLGALFSRTMVPTVVARDRPLACTVDLFVRMLQRAR